ncbi:acyltransferase family protein [Lonsdalea quercina]|uniref:acyltransferase family protein n=1 Tax=Lonsdalea quercina TaxID=71657 RepID=UPI0039769A63
MLGVIRFFLASCVILFHLTAKFPGLGLYAVNCFYVISGYLITMILNGTYQFHLKRFALNRFLRLYPSYYFLCLIALITIFSIDNAHNFHQSYTGEFDFKSIVSNLSIFTWAIFSDTVSPSPFSAWGTPDILNFDGQLFRLITSSWSVGVEIVCYFVLWVFTARRLSTTIITVVAAAFYHYSALHYWNNIVATYSPFIAAMLPFGIGSLGYFLSVKIEARIPERYKKFRAQLVFSAIFFVVFISNWLTPYYTGEILGNWHYYANNIIALFAVMSLHETRVPAPLLSVTRTLGDMSYPMFLCHFFCALIIWHFMGEPKNTAGWVIFIGGYGIALALSFLTIQIIDKPMSKVRDKIRGSSRTL